MEPKIEAHIDELTGQTTVDSIGDDAKNGEDLKKVKNRSGGGQRIAYIDALKGFLILCVVFGHVIGTYKQSEFFPIHEVLNKIYAIICTFHMPLFMMVSGYLYYSAYYSGEGKIDRNRMTRQILNLAGVYILFNLLHGFLKILTGAIAEEAVLNEITFVDVFLIPIKPLRGYWYLYTLIILYVVFSVIQKKKINEWVLLAIFFAISSVSHYTNIEFLTISQVMKHVFFFYIGLSYRKNGKWILENKVHAYFLFAVSVITLVISGFSIPHFFGVDTLVSLGMSMGIWMIFKEVNILNIRLLQFTGKISLEIYVMHNILLAFLRNLLMKIGINQPWACIFLNFALAVLTCGLITIVLKKIKLHDLFFRPATFIRHIREKHSVKQ